MPPIDINKRNQVLRRHHPDLFEEEAPPVHGKLRHAGGGAIDAIAFVFDGERPTGAWMLCDHVVSSILSDDPEVQQALLDLRREPPSTDTIIFDVTAISEAAGRDMLSAVFTTFSGALSPFRGLGPTEIATELVRRHPAGRDESGKQTVETLSLDEFFDGNGDDSSIAPNMVGYGHPGIDVFREVLHAIRARPEVVDVRIGVHEWPYPEEDDCWISGEQIFFWARGVAAEQILEWIQPLNPEGVSEGAGIFKVLGGPTVGNDVKLFWTTWD